MEDLQDYKVYISITWTNYPIYPALNTNTKTGLSFIFCVMSTKSAVFSLYRALTREAKKLSDYNFRSHAVRRVRKGFEMNREISW